MFRTQMHDCLLYILDILILTLHSQGKIWEKLKTRKKHNFVCKRSLEANLANEVSFFMSIPRQANYLPIHIRNYMSAAVQVCLHHSMT